MICESQRIQELTPSLFNSQFFDSPAWPRLQSCYAPRAYHNLTHIRELCDRFNESTTPNNLWINQEAAYLAILYHDAETNESKSAQFMRAEVDGLFSSECLHLATMLILTKRAGPITGDAALFVDIDHAIVGSAPERYQEYRDAIAEEYSAVPSWLFRKERARFLLGLAREQYLYRTEFFREQREAQAFANIQGELKDLDVRL